jgi:hypothetical protein
MDTDIVETRYGCCKVQKGGRRLAGRCLAFPDSANCLRWRVGSGREDNTHYRCSNHSGVYPGHRKCPPSQRIAIKVWLDDDRPAGDVSGDTPSSFEHRPGEFPIPIYWAYNNELSKAIGLDLSPYLGQRVEATVYELREELPEFLYPHTRARVLVVTHDGEIIGAWIDKGRHYAFACSLDRKLLEEITGMDWSEWLMARGVVNLDSEMERELATFSPEEIIARYYQALDDHEDERAYACLTRRSLTDFLFSNMDDLALYHSSYEDDPVRETIHSVRVIGIEPLSDAWNPEGVLEYRVDIVVKYETEIVSRSGHNARFVLLEKEIGVAGWRIIGIGTGP